MADNDRTMHRLHTPVVVFSLLNLVAPVFADDADSVRALQRVVDAQQRQLEAQSRQLEMQMRLIRQLQSEVERLAENADGAPLTPGDTRAHEPLASASAQDEI